MPWVHLMGGGHGDGPQQGAEHVSHRAGGWHGGLFPFPGEFWGAEVPLGLKCIIALGPEGQKPVVPSSRGKI